MLSSLKYLSARLADHRWLDLSRSSIEYVESSSLLFRITWKYTETDRALGPAPTPQGMTVHALRHNLWVRDAIIVLLAA